MNQEGELMVKFTISHDPIFVLLWGKEYKFHNEYLEWVAEVEKGHRALSAHKSDLVDVLRERQGASFLLPDSKRSGW